MIDTDVAVRPGARWRLQLDPLANGRWLKTVTIPDLLLVAEVGMSVSAGATPVGVTALVAGVRCENRCCEGRAVNTR